MRRNGQANGRDSSSSESTPPDTIVADDAANISSSDYARRCRQLMGLNNDLHAMGAGTLLDLPRIAVIGGQSAGKSSLVEAVSGINVPRDSGTCTRCPLECSMSSSAEYWSCEISLRFDYDTTGQPCAPKTVPFGPPLTDKSGVEIWLRRAQSAVLSPHLPSDTFLNKTYNDLQTATRTDTKILKFSKNAVCIDIKDPDATDLSFVDLPGLIQNATPESVELVKNLVVSYIKAAKTLILITIPMSDDMENQQAVRLAREADPGGERTVGVLTKPDTLGSGATSSRLKWKDLLEGRVEAHSLKNGYYSVRLPDDLERSQNLTRSESQARAAQFFDSTSPWNEITDRGRFGIPALISDLSQLLLQLIEDGIPKLKQDVDRLLSDCLAELGTLPELLTLDPTTEVIRLITAFCNDFKGAVCGDGIKYMAQQNRARYLLFKGDIRATAPDFRPFVDHTKYVMPSSADHELASTPHRTNPNVKPLNLRDVGKVIANSIAWELPNNVPFEAKKVLIEQFTQLWSPPALSCFDDVFATLSDTVHRLMTTHFGRFKQLESHIWSLTEHEIDICKEQALQAIKKTLELERVPIFTQNTHYFNSMREKWLAHYKAVYTTRWHYGPHGDSTNPEWSEFEQELVVMADVHAYFQVAYKRIIDYIPLTIEHELNQAIVVKLQTVLVHSLFAERSVEWRKSLLAEDPAIATKREKLEGTKQRLTEIKRRLADFGRHTEMIQMA